MGKLLDAFTTKKNDLIQKVTTVKNDSVLPVVKSVAPIVASLAAPLASGAVSALAENKGLSPINSKLAGQAAQNALVALGGSKSQAKVTVDTSTGKATATVEQPASTGRDEKIILGDENKTVTKYPLLRFLCVYALYEWKANSTDEKGQWFYMLDEKKKKKMNWLVIAVYALLLILGGWLIFRKKKPRKFKSRSRGKAKYAR